MPSSSTAGPAGHVPPTTSLSRTTASPASSRLRPAWADIGPDGSPPSGLSPPRPGPAGCRSSRRAAFLGDRSLHRDACVAAAAERATIRGVRWRPSPRNQVTSPLSPRIPGHVSRHVTADRAGAYWTVRDHTAGRRDGPAPSASRQHARRIVRRAPVSPRTPSPACRSRPARGLRRVDRRPGCRRRRPTPPRAPLGLGPGGTCPRAPPPRPGRARGGQRATARYRAPTPAAAKRITGPSSPSQTHSAAPRCWAPSTASAPRVETRYVSPISAIRSVSSRIGTTSTSAGRARRTRPSARRRSGDQEPVRAPC